MLTTVLVVLVVVIALIFDFTNGFHDAANAIATPVATKALTPVSALVMAAVMNLIGALLGTGVAETIAHSIIVVPSQRAGLVVTLAALIGAIIWNLLTWWKGLPSSSSHALIGGLVGAGLAAATTVQWMSVLDKVVLPMVISPLIGFGLAYGLMKIILFLFRNAEFHPTMQRFRILQRFSGALMALGHGLQDAQKTMGIIVAALVAGGLHAKGAPIPFWVKLAAASAIGLGTLFGGGRVMKTLGRGMSKIDPAQAFSAESVSTSVLYTTAFAFHAPISTTHVVTTSIMGVGAVRRKSAVKWGKVREILGAWVLTLPAAAFFGMLCFFPLHYLFGLFS